MNNIEAGSSHISKGSQGRTTVLLLVVLSAVSLYSWWTVSRVSREMRAELLQQVRLVAQAVNIRRIMTLKGTEADLANPDYLRLQEQLNFVRRAESKCRSLYLLGRREDGNIYLLVNSELQDSKDFLPPGWTDREKLSLHKRVFDIRNAVIEGPFKDSKGVWISAFVPLADQRNGEPSAVLGMDIDARDWKLDVVNRSSMPLGLAFLTVLLSVIFILLLRQADTGLINRQAQLSESEEKYHLLMEHAVSAIAVHEIILDSAGQPADYTFLSANPAFERHTGLKVADITRRRVTEIIPGIETTDLISIYGKVALAGEPVSFERYFEPLGKYFSINAYSLGKGLFATVFTDITERKRAEEELAASEKKFRNVFEDSPIGLELCDPEGKLIDINKACLDIFGITEYRQVLGRCLLDLIGFPDEARIQLREGKTACHEALFDFDRIRQQNLYDTYKYGKINIHIVVAPLGWDGRKAASGYLVQIVDVTMQRQFEEEREATLDLLRLLNFSQDKADLMKSVIKYMKDWSGCEAVGIRLKEGDDYPYYVTYGFDDDFVKAENYLCARDENGEVLSDCSLNPVLDCMCGNILRGRFDPDLPFFTGNGSFWTNSTTRLLATTTEEDRKTKSRNRCTGEGYESIALVPLRFGDQTFGLLQLNDRRTGCFTTEKIKTIESLCSNLAIGLAQRQSIEELQASRERLDFVVSGARMGWWDWDIRSGLVARSQIWADMLGYSLEEAQDPGLYKRIIHPEDVAWSEKIVTRHLNGQIPYFEYEARLRNKAGRYIWTLCRGQVVDRDAYGEPLRVSGTIQDISSQKQLDEERAKAARLESVGLLAGGIAHDFNNILTALVGNIALAKLQMLDEPEKALGILAEAESAAMRSKGLTKQLLTFSKGGEPVKRTLCVKTVVAETALFTLRGSKVKADFDFPEESCLTEADEGQLSQVFGNLVLNAIQAMPDGGLLKLSVSRESLGLDNGLHLAKGDYIRVSVQDQGTGIPPEYMDKIFDAYFTTKDKGSGLGLAASFSIIRRHGGIIIAQSEPGAGSVFSVYLTASSKSPVEVQARPAPEFTSASRILVMDDEEGIRAMASMMIKRMGHEVTVASDGEEALTIYRQALESGKPFDVVMLDLTVPGGLGGKETIKRLQEMNRTVKAVVSSGYSADDVCSRPEEYGFLDVISKPYTMNDLQATLERTIGSKA